MKNQFNSLEVILDSASLYESLNSRGSELNKILHSLENKSYPEGFIFAHKRAGGYQFYQQVGADIKYIRKRDVKTIEALIQKEYENKLYRLASNEYKEIERILSKIYADKTDYLKNPGRLISKGKLPFVKPVMLSDDEYVKQWLAMPPIAAAPAMCKDPFTTKRGDLVRSKSEMYIADKLYEMGLPYKYEFPVRIGGILLCPDFTILDIRRRTDVYYEHAGLMGDAEYCEKHIRKTNHYIVNGFMPGEDLLVSYESADAPLNQKAVDAMLQRRFA